MLKDVQTMPTQTQTATLDTLLQILVGVVCSSAHKPFSTQSLEILFRMIRDDPRMFSRFRPTPTTIRKMRLDYFLGSQVQKTADLGLDFSCFLLRYNKELSHGDFIDDVHI